MAFLAYIYIYVCGNLLSIVEKKDIPSYEKIFCQLIDKFSLTGIFFSTEGAKLDSNITYYK